MASRETRLQLQQWNARQLGARVQRILADYRPIMDKEFKDAIEQPHYTWTGRITIRSDGSEAGSPRNIVDTGAFRDSQVSRTGSSNRGVELIYTWGNGGVDYAGRILEGDGSNYPARDWIAKAQENRPFQQFFEQGWARYARRGA